MLINILGERGLLVFVAAGNAGTSYGLGGVNWITSDHSFNVASAGNTLAVLQVFPMHLTDGTTIGEMTEGQVVEV